MIAKWSEIFALLKMRLFGRTHFFQNLARRTAHTDALSFLPCAPTSPRACPHRAEIIFRQRARIGPRIRQHLVLFVKRLRDRQRVLAEKPKRPFAVALQARQIEEQRRQLRRWACFLPTIARLAVALGAISLRRVLRPTGARRVSSLSSSRLDLARIFHRTSGRCIRPPGAPKVPWTSQ